jgi:hypothetical protein
MIPDSGQIPLRFPEAKLLFEDMAITPSNRGVIAAVRRADHWPHYAFGLIGAAQSGLSTIATAWAVERGGQMLSAASFDNFDRADVERFCGGSVVLDRIDLVTDETRLLWLFSVIERLKGRLLVTAQTAPTQWSVASPDLRSRFKAMPVGDLGLPDEPLMRARIRRACQRAYLNLPPAVEDFLVTRLGLDYERIERAILRLDGAVSEGRALSIPLVKDVLDLRETDYDLFDAKVP